MLATDFIERHPSACEEAVEWVDSLGEGVTAEEAWEICPDGAWMAWAASELGVPEEERWVWADLARLWAADFLDGEGVEHRLRECSPIIDRDSADAAADVARIAAEGAESAAYVATEVAYSAVEAAESIANFVASFSPKRGLDIAHFDANYSAGRVSVILYICNTHAEDTAVFAANSARVIRERIQNPFRRN